MTTLKRAVTQLGSRAIDARTSLGRALAEWRRSLVEDLGGPKAITTAQTALVEVAVRSKLLLDSVDHFLLSMPSVVNRRRRSLFPIAIQRQGLVRELTHTLSLLGLERRKAEPKSLSAYLSERYGQEAEEGREEPGPAASASPRPSSQPHRPVRAPGTASPAGRGEG